MQVLAFVVVLLCYRSARAATIVVPTSTEQSHAEPGDTNKTVAKPEMYYFHVDSNVSYRYADTLISTRIVNPASVAQEVSFSAVLPETAFISGFLMEVDGKVYKAYVKEKEEAKHVYEEAVQHGQTAAHVALTARDSNRFTVSVNVEPQKKITFNLTYEELLSRKLGSYSDVINLDPGQIVEDFKVVVRIQENNAIKDLKVPALKTSNEIKKDSENDEKNPLAVIERPTPQSALITFGPNADQQKELAAEGIKGQFIVEYDVDRTRQGGEILVREGYFVHFFSPSDLTPLRKQVSFVLDVSGSMAGRKIEQLRQAMTTILDDLDKHDLFSIVLFSETAQVWDPSMNDTQIEELMREVGRYFTSDKEHSRERPSPSVIVEATPVNIDKAKKFVAKLNALSATGIYDGLMTALEISKTEPKLRNDEQKPEPIIIFLTDGLPNVRVSDPEIIVKDVTKENTKNCSIYSLALGDDADFKFLKKLSLRNSAFARKIYEASDTAIQLTDFYREVSSPLLANVTFSYAPDQVEEDSITKNVFRTLFSGSELVVAGKTRDENKLDKVDVQGTGVSGTNAFSFRPIFVPLPEHPIDPIIPSPEHIPKHNPSSMERLWAFLTIKQLLEEDEAKDYDHNDKNQTSPEKERALKMALQYSFVTPLTSLVVVKPNETKSVDTEDASKPSGSFGQGGYGGFPAAGIPIQGAVPISSQGFGGFPDRFSINPGASGSGGGFIAGGFPGGGSSGASFPTAGFPTNSGSFISSPREPVLEAGVFSEEATEMPKVEFLTTTAPAQLKSLADLAWLTSVLHNNTITLPTGANATAQVLHLASSNETNLAHQECMTPIGEPGHCRHLKFCVLDTFTNNKEDYFQYLCHIDSYAGVCCPDYIYVE